MDMNSTIELNATDYFIHCISKEETRKNNQKQHRFGNKLFQQNLLN